MMWPSRRVLIFTLLALATLTCTALLHFRQAYTESDHFHFLQWNLFLAWIPLICAGLALKTSTAKSPGARATMWPLVALWLLFLPNAPYLLTDFIHLRQWDSMPVWFDALLIGFYAGTGLLLGLLSLIMVHAIVARSFGRGSGWFFAVGSLGLAAFGTYLGRFGRFNSWDTLSRPSSLVDEIWSRLRHPIAHAHAIEFTLVFAVFLLGSYLVLLAVGRRRIGIPV
jgi:uncharacterized membrane protein